MKAPISLLIALPAAALALAGCVPEDGFPSLAPRPAERDRSMEPPIREAPEIASDQALRRNVQALERQAAEGDRAFAAAFGPAEAAVAAAGPAESDSWVEAQQAISQLEAARAATMRALLDLDRLAVERADMPTDEADFAAITTAMRSIEAMVAGQQARLDRLSARLARGS